MATCQLPVAHRSRNRLCAYCSVIKGVGEAIASKMVAEFGERTLEVRTCICPQSYYPSVCALTAVHRHS